MQNKRIVTLLASAVLLLLPVSVFSSGLTISPEFDASPANIKATALPASTQSGYCVAVFDSTGANVGNHDCDNTASHYTSALPLALNSATWNNPTNGLGNGQYTFGICGYATGNPNVCDDATSLVNLTSFRLTADYLADACFTIGSTDLCGGSPPAPDNSATSTVNQVQANLFNGFILFFIPFLFMVWVFSSRRKS